jgi:hypothetical protein
MNINLLKKIIPYGCTYCILQFLFLISMNLCFIFTSFILSPTLKTLCNYCIGLIEIYGIIVISCMLAHFYFKKDGCYINQKWNYITTVFLYCIWGVLLVVCLFLYFFDIDKVDLLVMMDAGLFMIFHIISMNISDFIKNNNLKKHLLFYLVLPIVIVFHCFRQYDKNSIHIVFFTLVFLSSVLFYSLIFFL